METETEEGEKLLYAQFESDTMRNQIKSWKQQSTMLRGVCKQFWEEYGTLFSSFWLEADAAIRLALTQTAMEDLPPACVGPLLELTCPELMDTETLTTVEEGRKADKLLILMEQVCKGEENKDCPLRAEMKDLGSKSPAEDTLFVVRSCMLLQYFTAIQLVWQHLAAQDDGEEG